MVTTRAGRASIPRYPFQRKRVTAMTATATASVPARSLLELWCLVVLPLCFLAATIAAKIATAMTTVMIITVQAIITKIAAVAAAPL